MPATSRNLSPSQRANAIKIEFAISRETERELREQIANAIRDAQLDAHVEAHTDVDERVRARVAELTHTAETASAPAAGSPATAPQNSAPVTPAAGADVARNGASDAAGSVSAEPIAPPPETLSLASATDVREAGGGASFSFPPSATEIVDVLREYGAEVAIEHGNAVRRLIEKRMREPLRGPRVQVFADRPFAEWLDVEQELCERSTKRGTLQEMLRDVLERSTAPAQPARSTPNDELRAGLKEAWNLAGVLADVAEHNAKTCDQDDEEGFVDHEAALQHAGGAEMARAIQREIKLLSKKLPAREKDGEAQRYTRKRDMSISRESDDWMLNRPDGQSFVLVKGEGHARAIVDELNKLLSAPRSPSPLSASTTETAATISRKMWQGEIDALTDRVSKLESGGRPDELQALKFRIGDVAEWMHERCKEEDAGREPNAPASPVSAVLTLAMERLADAVARVSAPSIAQQAASSEAGVPSVEECEDAFWSAFNKPARTAPDANRNGVAAVRALCLASRAPVSVDRVASAIAPAFCDDPFEDLRPDMQEDLRKAARLAMGCLASRGARGTEDAKSYNLRGTHTHLEVIEQSNGPQVVMSLTWEDVERLRLPIVPPIRALGSDDASPSRGERREAPASVERDEALEELAPKTFVRVCIIEPTRPFVFEVRGRMTLDMMKDIEHDLCECGGDFSHLGPVDATGATRWLEVTSHGAEYDDTGRKIAPSWLELTLCAMKSPPAPSSASMTPKNDGGAG